MAFGPFLVPQFIDAEPKILGPITVRQFLLLLICGLIEFILYKILYFNSFLIIGGLILSAFLIVAFFRVNGMPFHYFALNLIQTLQRAKLRVWRKAELKFMPAEEKAEVKKEFLPKPPLAASHLSQLSLVVNTGGAYREEE